ncbi:hypothetical protein K402DRAFT_388887 [Aulographum hederae CBS 113979]|uniref:Secreted protein n=1 Tax=Aulographum hederae CBS 113979 TaxID=1176131 RepID=A0A6G1HEX4_9PEZI|nr:hypothetical protein K402DRAFT_388887 [Aulographum hederae CBS 113979]
MRGKSRLLILVLVLLFVDKTQNRLSKPPPADDHRAREKSSTCPAVKKKDMQSDSKEKNAVESRLQWSRFETRIRRIYTAVSLASLNSR